MIRPLLLASTLALATGCAHYYGPEDSSAATVLFTSNNVAAQPMVCVPGKGFQGTRYALAQKPFESKAFTPINDALRKSDEVPATLPPGEPARIGVQLTDRQSNTNSFRCNAALLFTPQPGARYNAHFVRDGSQCGLGLSHEDGTPVADAVRVPWECH